MGLKKKVKYFYCKVLFRIKNRKKNFVYAHSVFPVNSVDVGKGTYGALNIVWIAPRDTKVSIGNYVSIAEKATFLVGGEHNYKRISTYPFQSKVYKQKTEQVINRDIVVEDDVWIGYDALIMSGVTIGKGSVIGARSVVAKDVPPYSIYVGNKVIKKRFSQEIIEKLMPIDFARITHEINDPYGEYCQYEINNSNVDLIIKKFCN